MICWKYVSLMLCPILLLHLSPLCNLGFPWVRYPKETAYLSSGLIGFMQLLCVQKVLLISNGSNSSTNSGTKGKKRRNLTTFSSFLRSCSCFILSTFLFHIMAIVFGAEVVNKADLTLSWSVAMATMAVGPTILLHGSHYSTFFRLFFLRDWRSQEEIFCFYVAVSVVTFAWFAAIPIPLDWDEPWQPWPRTCLFGGFLGYINGLCTFHWVFPHLQSMNLKHI